MFKKILIANRGEIACRVIKTARRMGIQTVAVYSDADARALHVEMADEAYHIGPAPSSESYLVADRILEVAKQCGADAIHPGYGFLSERTSFAEACDAAGIAFVGPPANAIAAMGDKIESKKLAKGAGVNTVPGSPEAIDTTEEALKWANDIGYPVMMKASAGGGGKGMRLAWNDKDVEEGFEATKREGLSSFGDDRVFIEKFIEQPRHIEIQVLGDKHGNIVYLHERECSIQRRHQKVVEEAPSPFVSPAMRKAMGEQAVALARAVGYFSAGTVELIVSGADKTGESFYFLEMNTRLQVEHPVTECITGLDLVEQMIRVAAGEELTFKQDEIKLDGWAVENRVYAEDPYRNFLPSIGRLVRYSPPMESTAEDKIVRVDHGVYEGGEVSVYYDPMIAKLISWAPTREAAIDAQLEALDSYVIDGPRTNIDFLSAIMQHPRFRSGEISTGFIAEEFPDGFTGAVPSPELARKLMAIATTIADTDARRCKQIDGQLDGPISDVDKWHVALGEVSADVTIDGQTVSLQEENLLLDLDFTPGQSLAIARFGGDTIVTQVERSATTVTLRCLGAAHELRVLPSRLASFYSHMPEKKVLDEGKYLVAPMHGLLTKLMVKAGDKVEPDQPMAIIEAMKMENVLRAVRAGTVKSVNAGEGESVAVDSIIIELE